VKVKRDGPRGWHWIAVQNYDPARHELVTDNPEPVAQADTPPPKRRGRPPKSINT
jgi:hypothetical protein